MENSPNTIAAKLGGWLGLVVTIVAIATSIFNLWVSNETAKAKQKVDDAQIVINDSKAKIEADLARVEQTKAHTERLKFVQSLFDNIAAEKQNIDKRTLSVNLIRLTLSEEDAQKLFNGFANSTDPNFKTAGEEVLRTIKTEKNAKENESDGFEYLRTGDFESALASFTSAYNKFPEYHNVDEIRKLLEEEKNRTNFSDANAKKKIIEQILRDYPWGMPGGTKEALKTANKF